MKKVLIPTKLDGIASKILTENGNYTVVQDSQSSLDEVVAANPDAYALIVRSEPVTAETIDKLPNLKVIITDGTAQTVLPLGSFTGTAPAQDEAAAGTN